MAADKAAEAFDHDEELDDSVNSAGGPGVDLQKMADEQLRAMHVEIADMLRERGAYHNPSLEGSVPGKTPKDGRLEATGDGKVPDAIDVASGTRRFQHCCFGKIS